MKELLDAGDGTCDLMLQECDASCTEVLFDCWVVVEGTRHVYDLVARPFCIDSSVFDVIYDRVSNHAS